MSGFCCACLRFCLCFCCCFHLIKWLELKGWKQEEEALSASVQAKHQPWPQTQRLSHYANFGGSWKTLCVKEDAVVHSVGGGHFARLVK